jgi:hypothetical protein
MIDESKIKEYSGTTINVIQRNGERVLLFSDAQDMPNTIVYPKVLLGDCDTCSGGGAVIREIYKDFTYDKVLVGGLGLGLIPEYLRTEKSCSVIDVIENNQELIDYVDYLESPINIIKGDALSYTPDKKYDLILIDLWWEKDDITQEMQDNIKNNYKDYLEANGKTILPIAEKEL